MDNLETLTIAKILSEQKKLQEALGHPMGYGYAGVKENVLAAIVELTEVLNETPWKPWKQYDPQSGRFMDVGALLTEMTDVLQFWANMVICMGFTPEEVTSALEKKWAENYRRLEDRIPR